MSAFLLSIAIAIAGLPGPFDEAPVDRTQLRLGVLPAPMCDAPMAYPAQLRDTRHLHRANPSRSYGTPWLTQLVEATARQVRYRHPDADPLFVGDLSHKWGGPMYGHRQHRDGRDADIGLYSTGRTQPEHGFARVWPSKLDSETTWALISALLSSGRVKVILLDQGLIDTLVDWLRESDTLTEAEIDTIFPAPKTPGLWQREGIVRGARNHADHLHVQVTCGR